MLAVEQLRGHDSLSPLENAGCSTGSELGKRGQGIVSPLSWKLFDARACLQTNRRHPSKRILIEGPELRLRVSARLGRDQLLADDHGFLCLSLDTFAAPNPDFQIGKRAPLSIKPSNTPGFSPGMALLISLRARCSMSLWRDEEGDMCSPL